MRSFFLWINFFCGFAVPLGAQAVSPKPETLLDYECAALIEARDTLNERAAGRKALTPAELLSPLYLQDFLHPDLLVIYEHLLSVRRLDSRPLSVIVYEGAEVSTLIDEWHAVIPRMWADGEAKKLTEPPENHRTGFAVLVNLLVRFSGFRSSEAVGTRVDEFCDPNLAVGIRIREELEKKFVAERSRVTLLIRDELARESAPFTTVLEYADEKNKGRHLISYGKKTDGTPFFIWGTGYAEHKYVN